MENGSGEIKIRTLPRSNEREGKKTEDKPKAPPQRRWIIYVGIAALALGAFTFLAKGPERRTAVAVKGKAKAKQGQADLASVSTRINDNVNRHMQDAQIEQDIMRRTREMENAPFKNSIGDVDGEELAALPEDTRNYGVQLDNDESVGRILEDINGDGSETRYAANETVADRITARLANRKWLNEQERAEKVQFLSSFIRSAYDKGYEVEIDSNLVVVGVKKINQNRVLDINQVIDRLAKGH